MHEKLFEKTWGKSWQIGSFLLILYAIISPILLTPMKWMGKHLIHKLT